MGSIGQDVMPATCAVIFSAGISTVKHRATCGLG